MKMKKALIPLAAAAAALCLNAIAQEPGAAATQKSPADGAVQQQGAQVTKKITVTNDIKDFLKTKGWKEGRNTAGSKTFIVETGIGKIRAPGSNPAYIESRAIAFEMAMMDAKGKFAKFLGQAIKTEAEKQFKQGKFLPNTPPPAEIAQSPAELSMFDKVKMLINAKLDEMLKAKGIDPAKATEAQKKEILDDPKISETFIKISETVSEEYLLGIQAAEVFECTPPGEKQGEVGVVAIWSEKLQQMASSIVDGRPLPPETAKKPLLDQLPSDDNAFLNAFGCKTMIDENGQLVLVGFGQASAPSEETGEIGFEKAEMAADVAIRTFAGEQVSNAQKRQQGQSYKEYEGAPSKYASFEAYQRTIKTSADALNIQGITSLSKWDVEHPSVGKTVYIVARVWSPGNAAFAKEIKAKMQEAPRPGAAPASQQQALPSGNVSKPAVKDKQGFRQKGVDTDNDAF